MANRLAVALVAWECIAAEDSTEQQSQERVAGIAVAVKALRVVRPRHQRVRRDEARQQRGIDARVVVLH